MLKVVPSSLEVTILRLLMLKSVTLRLPVVVVIAVTLLALVTAIGVLSLHALSLG